MFGSNALSFTKPLARSVYNKFFSKRMFLSFSASSFERLLLFPGRSEEGGPYLSHSAHSHKKSWWKTTLLTEEKHSGYNILRTRKRDMMKRRGLDEAYARPRWTNTVQPPLFYGHVGRRVIRNIGLGTREELPWAFFLPWPLENNHQGRKRRGCWSCDDVKAVIIFFSLSLQPLIATHVPNCSKNRSEVELTIKNELRFMRRNIEFSICDTLRKMRSSSRSFSNVVNSTEAEAYKKEKKI